MSARARRRSVCPVFAARVCGILSAGMVLQSLVAPSLRAQPAEPPQSVSGARLASEVAALVELGFDRGRNRLESARKHYDAARLADPSDPRVDYVWGLVLLNDTQHRQATARFEAAVASRGNAYWPAWQALIWAFAVEKRFDKALPLAEQFARLVSRGGPEAASQPEREAAALWLGRLLAAIEKSSLQNKKILDQCSAASRRVAETLGPDLQEAFELGGGMVEELHAALEEKSLAAGQRKPAAGGRKPGDSAERVKNRIDDLQQERGAAERSAEEWKKWLEANLEKADKALEAIEKEYQALEARGQALERQIVQLGQDLTRLEVQGALGAAQQGQGPTAGQQYLQKQNQLLNCQLEYNANAAGMQRVARRGQAAMQERAAMIERYQKATGELVKRSSDLQKWSSRAQEVKKKYDLQAAKQPAGGKNPARAAGSFKTYLPLDPRAQAQAVLESLGVIPEDSTKPPDP